jgi:polyphenol oxidase
MNDSGFIRREARGVPYYACRSLEGVNGLTHGFSTRRGGVSALPEGSLNLSYLSWDEAAAVDENRARFMAALRLEPVPLQTLSQIHSDRVHIIDEIPDSWHDRPRADALATRLRGVAIAVQVADCFPIILADRTGEAIAAIHAGWRGTVERIAAKTVASMENHLGVSPGDLLAAIGPGIRPCCFEVGHEVSVRFDEAFRGFPLHSPNPSNPSRMLLDLPAALRHQLIEAGVPAGQIRDLALCTMCNRADFFSYRGEGPRSGRLMAVVARRG